MILLIVTTINSCRLRGFYEPITLNLQVPDGPPEYKAGWRAGCRTALGAARNFPNAAIAYNADMGNGIYQHDSIFIGAWGHGWFACVIHANTFVAMPAMQYGPLE